MCRRPAACWLSGNLDDLTERLEHCSERCCRAVLAVSHAESYVFTAKTPLWPFWWLLAACAVAGFAIIGSAASWLSKQV